MPASLTIPGVRLRRWAFFAVAGATALAGSWMMARIVWVGGLTLLEAGILVLFVPTFSWIVLPFWTAVVGFVLQLARRDPLTLKPLPEETRRGDPAPGRHGGALVARTAVVMPIYQEDARVVAARVSAILQSLLRTGHADDFHVHLLSDTRDPVIARREEDAVRMLRSDHPSATLHYRRRERNEGRKAGNLAEFCRRCGDDYDLMVVLDADSLMSGPTLVRLVRAMEANPDVGLIQTVPLPARQKTLFGRLVQFAGGLYGPLLATGAAFWQTETANYWGHNAIVRLAPFSDHARLPVLSGRPPLGGQILSHDFVEAAYLRRAGWKVILDPTLDGSWEEVPGTVSDFAARDRRWAQGSLQHLRLVSEPGLHPLSRLHLGLGAMGYVSSLLWLLILLLGTVYVLVPGHHGPTLAGALPPVQVPLLAITAAVLFLPKAMGLLLGLRSGARRFGGRLRLVAGVLVETAFSVLLAPIMMLFHARAVTEIVLGRSVEWGAQDRDAHGLSWRQALAAGGPATVVGLGWGGATLTLSPGFFVWMSPIFTGLVLAVPLIRWTSSARLGLFARRHGLLRVPAEVVALPELAAAEAALRPASADPSPVHGVFLPPKHPGAPVSHDMERSMYNAERGLFELRQGRPLLITGPDDSGGAHGSVLVASVESLDDDRLHRLRQLAGGPLRLVLTPHRISAMGLTNGDGTSGDAYVLALDGDADAAELQALAAGPPPSFLGAGWTLEEAGVAEIAGLELVRMGRLLPALVAAPVRDPRDRPGFEAALQTGAVLSVPAREARSYVASAGREVVRVSEAPVPLPDAGDSTFILFREASGLQEHVAILVGDRADWPDPVPVRLHSACLTGDLFGSLRCDCGEQLRGSMKHFADQGGGILLYLAQEGRGIGLRNKFRAYTLQEGGLDTIDADGTLGFGADERRYDVAVGILRRIGVRRIELLTNNPEKMRAMEEAGIQVAVRRPLHGTLNRHNLPYVRAKVKRAGHWLGDMLAQPLAAEAGLPSTSEAARLGPGRKPAVKETGRAGFNSGPATPPTGTG
ncbi:MAG: glucans biosynthesis glucosyltransferase MdoH [Gemmatimonadota bacterium]